MALFERLVPVERNTYENKTVHEHRAPTDESVKILHELEKEAQDKILGTIDVQNNVLNGAVIFQTRSDVQMTVNATVKFKLNGRDFVATTRMQQAQLAMMRPEDVRRHLFEAMAETIALEILKKAKVNQDG